MADAADEDSWEQAPAARMTSAPDAIAALAHASTAQRAALRHLLERTGGGGLVDRPRIAVTDALTGALLALTDARELRARGTCTRRACRRGTEVCTHDMTGLPGLGPPGPSRTYRPGVAARPVRPRPRASMSPTRLPQPSATSRRAGSSRPLARGSHLGRQPHRLLHEPSPREAPGPRLALRPVVRRNPHGSHAQRPDGINGTAALLRSPVHRPGECPVGRRTRRIPFDRDDGSHRTGRPRGRGRRRAGGRHRGPGRRARPATGSCPRSSTGTPSPTTCSTSR